MCLYPYYDHGNIPKVVSIFSFDMTPYMVQRVVICTTPLCFDCTCCFRDHMPAQEPLLISGECFRADCICFFQILLKLNHRICPVRHECYGQFLSKVKHLNQILLCNYVNIICDIFCHLKLRDYA